MSIAQAQMSHRWQLLIWIRVRWIEVRSSPVHVLRRETEKEKNEKMRMSTFLY